jgi:autotransporter-associated beta strand protein
MEIRFLGFDRLWKLWSAWTSSKVKRRPARRSRLQVEPLERRELLAVKIWTGLGSDANWTTANNWVDTSGNATSLVGDGTDDLIYLNSVNTVQFGTVAVTNKLSTDNLAAGTTFDSITFGGSGFVVSGNSLTLSPQVGYNPPGNLDVGHSVVGISASSAGTNTITASVKALQDQTWQTTVSGATIVYAGVGSTTINLSGSITFDGPGTQYLQTTMTGGGGFSKNDSGALVITSGANSFTGSVAINAGIVTLQNLVGIGSVFNALGAGSGNITVNTGAVLKLSTNALTNFDNSHKPLTLFGSGLGNGALENTLGSISSGPNAWQGPITLGSNTTIGVDSGELAFTQNALLTGSSSLTKIGQGILNLQSLNNSNSFSGNLIVNEGVLAFTDGVALGSSTNGSILVATGATLQFAATAAGSTTAARPLTLNGLGFGVTGQLGNLGALQAGRSTSSASLIWSGPIFLNSTASIGSNFGGLNSLVITGNISGPGDLIKTGIGLVSIQGTGNTYQGNTTVDVGNLVINNGGSIANSLNLTVNENASLTLDDTAGLTSHSNSSGRVSQSATLFLNGGNFNFIGTTGIMPEETLGAVVLNSGFSTISMTRATSGGLPNIVTINSLSRSAGAQVNFLGVNGDIANSGLNNLVFTNRPALVGVGNNAILPYATVSGTSGFDFVTFNSFNGIERFTNYFTGTLASAPSGAVYKMTTAQSLNISKTLNALIISGASGTTDLTGTGSLSLSGASALAASSTGNINVSLPSLVLGTEGLISTGSASTTLTLSSSISGNTGLTTGGLGTLFVAGSTNTFSGGTVMNSGTLNIAGSGTLGSGTLTLSAGTLAASAATTVINPVVMNNSLVTLGGARSLTFATSASITGINTITSISVSGSTHTYSGQISGNGSLVLTGSLQLLGSNTFTGGVVQNGFIQLGTNTSLGTGPLTIIGGSLTSIAGVKLPNPVSIVGPVNQSANGFGASIQILNLTYPIEFSGTVNSLGAGANQFNVSSGPPPFVTSLVFGGGLAGAAPLFISGASVSFPVASPNYSGAINFSGTVAVGTSDHPLGTGVLGLSGVSIQAGLPLAPGTPLTIENTLNFTSLSVLGPNPITFTGLDLLNTNSTINIQGTATFSNSIFEGSAGKTLSITGAGALSLTGGNAFSGVLTLNQSTSSSLGGVTDISSNAALGSGTLTLTAGTLQFDLPTSGQDPVKVANPVNLNTAGNTPFALGGTGNVTFKGPITAGSAAVRLFVNNPTTTFAGALSGTGGLTLGGAGTLLLVASNTGYSGAAVISGGTLALTGSAGSLINSSAFTVNNGGTLVLDNTAGANTSRVSASVPLNLSGGTLRFLGSANQSLTQSVGTITLGQGLSTIELRAATDGLSITTLSAGGLTRAVAGATVNFRGANSEIGSSNNQLQFANLPTLSGVGSNGILPYAVVSSPSLGLDLATFSGGSVVRFTNYNTDINSAAGNTNVKLTATQTLSNSSTFNALLLTSAGTSLDGVPGATLTLTSGALVDSSVGPSTISVPTLAFGSEGIVAVGSNGLGANSTTISSLVAGTSALTLAGNGTVILPNANTFSGGTFLDGPILRLGDNQALGSGTATLIRGAVIGLNPSGTTLSNPLVFNNSAVTFGAPGAGPLAFGAGSVTVNGAIDYLSVNSLTKFGGSVTGTANLTKQGTGTLVLSGANNLNGQTSVSAGVLNVQSTAGLGGAGNLIVASGAALQLANGVSSSMPLFINGSGANFVTPFGFDAPFSGAIESLSGSNTLSGPMTLMGSSAIGVDLGALTLSGNISGAGDLNKVGFGTLNLATANSFTGATNAQAGILAVGNGLALGAIALPVTVSSGATLQMGSFMVFGKQLNLSGQGVLAPNLQSRVGAFQASGSAMWNGNIALNPGATFGALTGAGTNVGGIISDATNQPADLVLNGSLNVKSANNTYTGATIIQSGTLGFTNAGAIPTTSGVTVNFGAALTINNGGFNVNQRFSPAGTTPITLNGGTFNFAGSNAVPTIQSVGTITLGAGHSTINMGGGSGIYSRTVLNSTALVRNDRGTANFLQNAQALGSSVNALGQFTNQILFGNSAALTSNSILPYATAPNSNFAAYDPVRGLVGFSTIGSYVTSMPSGATTANVQVSSIPSLSANTTVNSLSFSNAATLSLNGFTLTVTSGGIAGFIQFADVIKGGNLIFGTPALPAEAILLSATNSVTTNTLNIQATISGSNGLTFGGPGTLLLQSAATFSGGTVVNSGVASVNKTLSGDVTVNAGGTLGGVGVIGGNILANGGTVDPGSGGAILTASSANFFNGGTYNAEVFGTGPAGATNGYDRLVLTSAVNALTLAPGIGGSKIALEIPTLAVNPHFQSAGLIQTPNATFSSGFGVFDITSHNPSSVPSAVTYSPPTGSVVPFNANSVDLTLFSPALSNVALFSPGLINEGDIATVTGSMQNVGANDTFTLVVDWGDSLNSPVTLSLPGTQTFFVVTHSYLDNVPPGPNSTFNINLTISNATANTGSTSLPPLTVVLSNLPPTVSGQGFAVSTINENSVATLTGTLTDPGALDTFSLVINWADGNAPQTFVNLPSGLFTATHLYLTNASPGATTNFAVSLAATDDDGGTSSTVTSLEMVHVPIPSDSPTLAGVGLTAASINENDVATLSATLSDSAPQDTFTLVVDWADGSAAQTFSNLPSGTFTATHRYLDNVPHEVTSTFTINLAITDSGAVTAPTTTAAITVNNLPPTLTGAGFNPATINENDIATLTVSLTDPGTLDTFMLVIDWADGSAPQTFNNLPSGSFTATHRYLDNVPAGSISNVSVGLSLQDDDGTVAPSATVALIVNNVAPTPTAVGGAATAGTPFTLTGSFTDPGTLDTFSFLWHLSTDSNGQAIGDITTQNLTFTPNHSGTYTFSFRVTDDDGGAGNNTVVVTASGTATTDLKVDFDASSGPATTSSGYVSVLGSTLYSAGLGYGWLTAPTGGFDRMGSNLLLRDGNYGGSGTAGARTFQTDLANGSYLVNVTMGDASYTRDAMQVKNADNGAVLLPNVTTVAGQFFQAELPVTVTDGSLDLQFSDQSGDPYWVVNALEIRPMAAVIPVTFSSGPGAVGADGLTTDTVNGSAAVPNGTILTVSSSLGTIITDSSTPYAGSQVVVNGGVFSFQITRPTASGTPTLTVTAVDGSAQGSTTNAAVLSYQPAATRRFDFNGPSNVTAAGFIGVRGSNLYSASTGFGWNLAASEFERSTAAMTTVALYRDGNYGTAARTFEVQVTPGATYGIRVYIGDASYARDNIQVSAEGGASTVVPFVGVNQFASVILTGVDANSDGILAVTMQDTGGDPYWVINGMDVSAGGVGNLPGGAPLQAIGTGSGGKSAGSLLTSQALAPIMQEGIARWQAAGIGSQAVTMLQGVKFQITNLDGLGDLGLSTPGLVQIDDDGDGYGWFIDPTPQNDVEFATSVGTTEWQAIAGSAALGHMDLLTVVMHELGHELGLTDLSVTTDPHALMAESITTGTRRLPQPLSTPPSAPMAQLSVVSDTVFASLAAPSSSTPTLAVTGGTSHFPTSQSSAIPLRVEANLPGLQPSLVLTPSSAPISGAAPRKPTNSVDAVFNLLGR